MRTSVRIRMSDTTLKGAIAESAITAVAAELGRGRTAADDRGPALRPRLRHRPPAVSGAVQVGAAARRDHQRPPRQCRHTPRGYIYSTYTAAEIDAVAVYCQELKLCYWLPIDLVEGKRAMYLRLQPAANGQQSAINYAERYLRPGAIAQLGERLAGSQKVAGSSPAGSTPKGPQCGPFAFSGHVRRRRARAAS